MDDEVRCQLLAESDSRRRAEIEALVAIYGDAVVLDDNTKALLEDSTAQSKAEVYSLRVCVDHDLGLQLHLVVPSEYLAGDGVAPICWLECQESETQNLSRAVAIAQDEVLLARVVSRAEELAAQDSEALVDMCQEAEDAVRQALDLVQDAEVARQLHSQEAAEVEDEENDLEDAALRFADISSKRKATRQVLGRRAMFSHHIIADSKRRVIVEWAAQLGLGGYSKIGWPGVIIVEGEETAVQAYVDALSRLRWKHFVVRGESIVEGSHGECVDDLRQLPKQFEELGVDAMSALAQRCREFGLEDLFLAALKLPASAAKRAAGPRSRR
eukprot:TRINITY_DN62268_c0_g1_i1.p1 TRINITY_DN62268_c0_g1~~TRINITY_DN62268_c0_g1_i1.p1  ORF type:complete len:328 (-),score=64.76 TRINITY_DN62268_c0_g1_i1:47-1030(-)